MALHERIAVLPFDEEWNYALVVGGVSVALTVATSWPGLMHLSIPLLAAGVAAGYLASGAAVNIRRVGVLTGLVSVLPVLYHVVAMYGFVAFGMDAPLWFRAAGAAVVIPLYAGVSAAIGAAGGVVGAEIGAWIAGKRSRERPFADPA